MWLKVHEDTCMQSPKLLSVHHMCLCLNLNNVSLFLCINLHYAYVKNLFNSFKHRDYFTIFKIHVFCNINFVFFFCYTKWRCKQLGEMSHVQKRDRGFRRVQFKQEISSNHSPGMVKHRTDSQSQAECTELEVKGDKWGMRNKENAGCQKLVKIREQ